MFRWGVALWMVIIFGYPVMACEHPKTSTSWPAQKTMAIPVVQDQETLMRYLGQKVQLQGRYVAHKQIPDINSAGIWNPDQPPIPHIRATIVLMDGTVVALYPPTHKQSLRAPSEADQFDQHTVVVEGILEPESGADVSQRFVISPLQIKKYSPKP